MNQQGTRPASSFMEKSQILEGHLQSLKWHPANPRAMPGSAEATQWGIPPHMKPPKDAVEYVAGRVKRDLLSIPQKEHLDPDYKFSVIAVTTAHFLWLHTKAGAAWLLRFYGVEEQVPFSEGYQYFYWCNGQGAEVGGNSPFKLRIFQSVPRETTNPIISTQGSPRVDELKDLIEKFRSPLHIDDKGQKMPFPHAPGGMYHLVSNYLLDWFFEPKPDVDFPYRKPDRISGFAWAKTAKRDETHLTYAALERMEMYLTRAYRIEDAKGGPLWCGRKDMRVIPRVDMARRTETMSEHEIRNVYECSSCGKIRPCLPVTGQHKMCCNCFGAQMERDQRPTLDRCIRTECKACPVFLSDHEKLNMLKSRLNRDVEFPGHRHT